jgi:chemotaxis signal transduction protein
VETGRLAAEQALPGYVEGVHLLVFELAGQSYGVDVDQVEIVVESELCEQQSDKDQAAYPALWHYGGEEAVVEPLARWVGLDLTGEAPSRVLFSRSAGTLRGFLVDTPKDIVTLPVDQVFPMPDLIRRVLGPSSRPSPLWGVGRSSQALLLLVDLSARPGAA